MDIIIYIENSEYTHSYKERYSEMIECIQKRFSDHNLSLYYYDTDIHSIKNLSELPPPTNEIAMYDSLCGTLTKLINFSKAIYTERQTIFLVISNQRDESSIRCSESLFTFCLRYAFLRRHFSMLLTMSSDIQEYGTHLGFSSSVRHDFEPACIDQVLDYIFEWTQKYAES